MQTGITFMAIAFLKRFCHSRRRVKAKHSRSTSPAKADLEQAIDSLRLPDKARSANKLRHEFQLTLKELPVPVRIQQI